MRKGETHADDMLGSDRNETVQTQAPEPIETGGRGE